MSEYREFSSYNGFDRTAMFMGIPLLWAIGLLTLAVFVMFVGMYFFDMVGFLFILLVLPIALFLRMISQTDDKALDILKLEIYYRLKRVAYKEFGNTLTFMPDAYLRPKDNFTEFFTNTTDFIKTRELQ